MSEAPAWILITWAGSGPGETSSPKTRSKATVKTGDDLTCGDMARIQTQKCSASGNLNLVFQPKTLKTQHQLGRSIGRFPGDFHFALTVGKNREAVGRCFSFVGGHIGFQHPSERRAGVFHAHDYFLVLGMVRRNFYH